MYKLLLCTALLFLVAAGVSAQNHLFLHLAPRLGAAPFALNAPVSAGAYEYKITRLEYYVSGIVITHDGGQQTALPDVYLLVRPAQDSLYDLGVQPGITSVEAISFAIGVDPANNHGDPAAWPAGHPLAPQVPDMHWGWASGYRFIALEGVAGDGFLNEFQIHAVGDANYESFTVPTAAEPSPDSPAIHLVADYAQLLTGIDVSAGLFAHSDSGTPVKLLNNMRSQVFSAVTVGTDAPVFEGKFLLSANPARVGAVEVNLTLPVGHAYRLLLTDALGRVLISRTPSSGVGAQTIALNEAIWAPGIYFVHLWQDGHPVAVRQWLVMP